MSRLSLAQTLPPELLSRIFGWLVEIQVSDIPDGIVDPPCCLSAWPVTSRAPALRSSALVCRHWRVPAQEMLFRAIDITDVTSEAFAFALRQRPDLAEAVQAINAGRPTAESHCRDRPTDRLSASLDIVSDFCPNIRHVYIASFPRTWKERLARFLASRELHTIISDGRRASLSERTDLGYLSMQNLSRLAPSVCSLASLCTPHPAHVNPPLPIPPAPRATPLTTLAVSISWKRSVAVQELLTSVASSLKYFDFYTETQVTFNNFGSALETLQTLEKLRAYVGVESDQGWFQQILPSLRSLKKLFITSHLAPPSIVLAAPASLDILEYEWSGVGSDEMVDCIESFRKAFRQGKECLPYRVFRLSLYPTEAEARLALRTVTALADACCARGVELDLTYWEETTGCRFPRESYISFFWQTSLQPQ